MGSQNSSPGGYSEIQGAKNPSELKTIARDTALEIKDKGENIPEKISQSRMSHLMSSLQRIAKLQRSATGSSVTSRQKKREATFKRQDVWMTDAKLMAEVQRLEAQGKLAEFDELKRLAVLCQNFRDDLGPLEQEVIETEQEWEGSVWKLQQAEEQLYSDFNYEFDLADVYSEPSSSSASSQYSEANRGSLINVEQAEEAEDFDDTTTVSSPAHSRASSSNFVLDPVFERSTIQETEPANSTLLGIGGGNQECTRSDDYIPGSDSIGDIDEKIDNRVFGGIVSLPPSSSGTQYNASNDLFPELLHDFASRRERMNKWLKGNLLISHIEGVSLFTILEDTLEAERQLRVPSNWSQLVIAYWEVDGAALQHHERQPDVSKTVSVPTPSENTIDHGVASLAVPLLGLRSRGSSNVDHGYFSDYNTRSEEIPRELSSRPLHSKNSQQHAL